MANHIDELRKQEWMRSPRTVAFAYGFKIHLNPNERWGVSHVIAGGGCYELHVTELFKKILRKNMVVVDVGANIGWFTLLSGKRVGNMGLVLAFEPEPDSFALLTHSIEINGLTNICAYPMWVASRPGERLLYSGLDKLGTIQPVERTGKTPIMVRAITLNQTLKEKGITHVSLIKIDTEGAEPEVLEGASDYLDKTDNIIMEWNREFWPNHKTLLRRLETLFKLHEIIRSPFLLKKRHWKELTGLPTTNLYLHRKT